MHLNPGVQSLLDLVESRAQNLFLTRQLQCAEAVLLVLNRGFGGGLPDETAIRLTSFMAEGLGGSGCLCGALGGGILALGLFLGRDRPGGKDRYNGRKAVKAFHSRFRKDFGSTCCRVLNRKAKGNARVHFEHCIGLTGYSARMAAQIILTARPELAKDADWVYLKGSDSKFKANLLRIANRIHS